MQEESFMLIDQAVAGNKQALEHLLTSVQDPIYNMSLRMLGSPHDAEDATQEIMIKIMTSLSTFRKESAFSTWVYRISMNYLINYKKTVFARQSLSFEYYAEDINAGFIPNTKDMMQGVEENILTEELKSSCTNVMLQCLDPESRCIYVLGVMFRAHSSVCGEILGISAETYRKRLSRIRKKVSDFLKVYCGLSGTGKCNCQKRVGYAIQSHRLNPQCLEYGNLNKLDSAATIAFTEAMEDMEQLTDVFEQLPKYHSPFEAKHFLEKLLNSHCMNLIKNQDSSTKYTEEKTL